MFVYLFPLDSTDHQLTFEPNSQTTHYCYQPLIEPYIGRPNSASFQLVPPLPLEGTILVAHTENESEMNFFTLRIENNRVIFQYRTLEGVKGELVVDTELEKTVTTYQIDLATTFNSAEVRLSTVDANSGLMEVGRVQTSPGIVLYPKSAIFSIVCIGGSLLEYRNYVGTLRRSFYGYNSLLEERNACELKTEAVARSNFINFVDNDVPRSLTFNRFTFGSPTIEFQARYPPDTSTGIVILAENANETVQFFITPFLDELTMFLRDVNSNFDPSRIRSCMSITIADGEWHFYNITTVIDPPEGVHRSIIVTVDGEPCVFQNSEVSRLLPLLIDSPLHFGITHSVEELRTFTGCASDIRLRRSEDSEMFRPNLEALPRVNPLFNIDFCYHCDQRATPCPSEHVCVDRGFEAAPMCECREGFAGETCQGERGEGF